MMDALEITDVSLTIGQFTNEELEGEVPIRKWGRARCPRCKQMYDVTNDARPLLGFINGNGSTEAARLLHDEFGWRMDGKGSKACPTCLAELTPTKEEPMPTLVEWGEHCDACGWCDTPGRCIAAQTCPTCGSGPKELCREGSRFVKYHDARWALVEQPTEEVNMSGKPDPKNGKTAPAKERSATATAEKPKAEKKGLDAGYVKSVVSRVEKGLKYSEIEKEFDKAGKAVPAGFKAHYPAIRKAAIDHFGSVQKVNETRGRAKLAAAEAESK